jgi:hypothetical protein
MVSPGLDDKDRFLEVSHFVLCWGTLEFAGCDDAGECHDDHDPQCSEIHGKPRCSGVRLTLMDRGRGLSTPRNLRNSCKVAPDSAFQSSLPKKSPQSIRSAEYVKADYVSADEL